jgi:small subunit ribosomal protein S25e
MGGTKKKTLASMEKSQDDSSNSAAGGEEKGKKKTEKAKVVGERKKVDVLQPRMNDQELMKSLASLKAITVYGAARSLAVNAAVAKSVLTSLEAKGLVKRAGGFSGHYIWTAAS